VKEGPNGRGPRTREREEWVTVGGPAGWGGAHMEEVAVVDTWALTSGVRPEKKI
jgi:hypothetical protein